MSSSAEAGRTSSGMQLLAQDYGEILAALEASTESKGHERRTAARMEVQAQVKIVPFGDGRPGTPYTCLTRDLSFKGIGLLQGRQSARGSQFILYLPRKEDAAPLALVCSVMFCRELADGLFNIGAAFVAPYDPTSPTGIKTRARTATSAAETELDRIRQSILG
jgi:hypothetical protein